MAVKKAYNHENELLACRPSPEVMIQIFMPGHATLYSMVSYFYQIHWQLAFLAIQMRLILLIFLAGY